jgi:toxin ParE1/3/4
MSRIELAPEVGDDFERILDHLAQFQVENPALRIREIIEAINVLEHNPMIGRPANNDKRELVIGHRSHGYVALYRYIVEIDTVFILAVRSQKEAGEDEHY